MENRKPGSIKLSRIADLVGGNLIGNGNTMITGVAGLKDATRSQISFLANLKYISSIESSDAAALIIPKDIDVEFRPVIKVDNPYLACIGVINLFNGATHLPPDGIHPNAEISRTARIGNDCHISTFVVIEDDVVIGERCFVFPGVFIGKSTVIGDDCIIYPNVTIREKITIGSRVIVHSGTVLGSDGFGYAHDKGLIKKIPQVGTVIIEDDVEIGANVCVDRATFGKTHIKSGTKIDNLVQIAHNVVIGNNATVVAQVGISGSTEIGDGVTLAGQSGIAGHLKVGPNTVVAAKSGVTKDIPGGLCVSGFPAQDHKKEKRLQAHIHTLPQLRSKVIKQEERINNLENQVKELLAELQRTKSTEK